MKQIDCEFSSEIKKPEWVCDLAFSVDIFDKLNELNRTVPYFPNFFFFFSPCHNFFPLSSVQIIIIPACCLLCVL